VFLDLKNGGFPWKFADILFVSWDPSYIRSVGRHFELLWMWLIIWRHLRHHKKCARALLPLCENRIKKFQSVPEIQGVQLFTPPPRFTLQISGRLSKVNNAMEVNDTARHWMNITWQQPYCLLEHDQRSSEIRLWRWTCSTRTQRRLWTTEVHGDTNRRSRLYIASCK